MPKQKQKKWIKRIIIAVIISLVLVINAPGIVGYITDNGHSENSYMAYAADPVPSSLSEQTDATIDRLNTMLHVQKFLNKLLWPVLYMIGGLMDNSLLFGGGMGQSLRDLWVPIRNIVNILFVIALVGIAIYNILGLGEDGGNYGIKTILPKIIIGIIAVNFSFLGIKVALDAVNVVTTAIFALPNEIGDQMIFGDTAEDKKNIESICLNAAGVTLEEAGTIDAPKISGLGLDEMAKTATFKRIGQKYGVTISSTDTSSIIKENANKLADGKEKTSCLKEMDEYSPICNGRDLADSGKAYFDKFKASNVALALALNMTHFQMLPQQDLASLKSIDDVGKLVVNAIFGVVMYVVFAVSFVALMVVLFARVVVMWLSIVLSPLLIVTMAVPQLKEQLSAVSKISEHFVKHLIAPVPIAFSLSIGWIMLKVVKNQNLQSVMAIGTDTSLGIPVVGLSTLQDIIVAVGCVAIVWMGVFTSAGETLAAGLTNWMGEKVQAFGKFLGTAPFKYTKFIPIGGDKYTFGAVSHAINEFQRNLERPDTELVDDYKKWFDTVTEQDLKYAKSAESYIGYLKGRSIRDRLAKGDESLREGLALEGLETGTRNELKKSDYDELRTLMHQYSEAEDEGERKRIGKEINRLLESEAPYKNIEAKDAKEDSDSGGSDSQEHKPPTAPADDTHNPAPQEHPKETEETLNNRGYQKVGDTNVYTNESGELVELNTDGTTKKLDEEKAKEFNEKEENKSPIDEAKKRIQERRKKKDEELHASELALANKRKTAQTQGYDDGNIRGLTSAGDVYTARDGTIFVSVSDTVAYEVDPQTGELKALNAEEIKQRKPKSGKKVGRVESGEVTIEAEAKEKTGDKSKENLTALEETAKAVLGTADVPAQVADADTPAADSPPSNP